MGKTLLVYDMNLREMENYEKIYKDIGKDEQMLLFAVWQRLLWTSLRQFGWTRYDECFAWVFS